MRLILITIILTILVKQVWATSEESRETLTAHNSGAT
jgi:hypothetical protein